MSDSDEEALKAAQESAPVPPVSHPEPAIVSLEEVAKQVLNGEWGSGVERRRALAEAGYDPNEVAEAVIEVLNPRYTT